MNIQASGLMSLFSGLETFEGLQNTWLQDGVLPEQFAAALTEQLELLQQAQENMLPIDSSNRAAILQDIAALSGKRLPQQIKEMDIDLDETLQALADVLKNIEFSQETDEQFVSGMSPDQPGVTEEESSEFFRSLSQDALVDNKVKSEQEDVISDSMLAPVLATLLQDGSRQQAAELVNEVVEELPQSLVHRTVPLSDQGSKDVEMSSNVLEETASLAIKSKGTESESPMQQENFAGNDRESFMKAVAKDREAVTEFSENQTVDETKEKNLSKWATDIAALNRAVTNESKAEIAPMSRHFAHPQWGQELSERVVWMHKQAVPSAELNLNPRHLGPITIRVDVNQDQTTVAFAAQHAVVKDAIEAAIPKLREMLGSQHLNLVDVNVSQQQSDQKQSSAYFQSSGEQGRGGQEDPQSEFHESETGNSVADEIEAGRAIASQGLLSIFA